MCCSVTCKHYRKHLNSQFWMLRIKTFTGYKKKNFKKLPRCRCSEQVMFSNRLSLFEDSQNHFSTPRFCWRDSFFPIRDFQSTAWTLIFPLPSPWVLTRAHRVENEGFPAIKNNTGLKPVSRLDLDLIKFILNHQTHHIL